MTELVAFDFDGTLIDHRVQEWTRYLEDTHFSRYLAGEIDADEQRRARLREFLPTVGLPEIATLADLGHFYA